MEGTIQDNFLTLAAMLSEIEKNRLYEQEYGSMHAFAEEFKTLSHGSISKLIQVYDKAIVEWQVPREDVLKVGWTNAYMIIKERNPSTPRRAMLAFKEVAEFAGSDTRAEIKAPGCSCEDCFEIILRQCRKCGKRTKVGIERVEAKSL